MRIVTQNSTGKKGITQYNLWVTDDSGNEHFIACVFAEKGTLRKDKGFYMEIGDCVVGVFEMVDEEKI